MTLALGGVGALGAIWLGLPAATLIGPSLLVTAVALAGVRVGIADIVRDICFLFIGLSVGAGFVPEAGAAILRWPLAFLALGVTLGLTIAVGGWVLRRFFGFDRTSGVLAAAPGHLSFVLSISMESGGDVGRVVIVQSMRLLTLTLVVPFLAVAMGYEVPPVAVIATAPMALWVLGLLAMAGLALGWVFGKLKFPAPLVLGAMGASAVSHVVDLTPGGVPQWILMPAYVVMGTLIGTRFAMMSWRLFRQSAVAGLVTTLVGAVFAGLGAIPVAWALEMELPHVLVSFSPGGLETMIALGAIMGVNAAFLTACHVVRLVILSAMIPFAVSRAGRHRPAETPDPAHV